MTEQLIRDALRGRVDDLVGPRTAPPPFVTVPRRSPRLWLSAAAAAVLVAALAVTAPLVLERDHAPTTTKPTVDPHYTLTVRRVEQTLAHLPLLPRARRADRAPRPALEDPPQRPGAGHQIHRVAWWIAPGSAPQAISFFRTHLPREFRASGSGALPGVEYVIDDRPSDDATADWQVLVTVTSYGSRVGVRADVFASWRDTRHASTRIGRTTGVDIIVSRDGAVPTVRRHLTATAAQGLAAIVDALPIPTPGVRFCPALRGGDWTDHLQFTTARGTVTVSVTVTGCWSVSLDPPSGRSIGLEVGTLDEAILQALGLPEGYGLR